MNLLSMRLRWYWLCWLLLVLFAWLQHDNALFPVFLFVLLAFFAFLLLVTWRWLLRRGFRSLWERLTCNAHERKIRERDSTTESPLERLVAQELDAQGILYEREYLISRTHVDFAFPKAKLAVECDGWRYHHTVDAVRHDAARDAFLERNGWKVLRLRGDEIRSNPRACVKRIRKYL